MNRQKNTNPAWKIIKALLTVVGISLGITIAWFLILWLFTIGLLVLCEILSLKRGEIFIGNIVKWGTIIIGVFAFVFSIYYVASEE